MTVRIKRYNRKTQVLCKKAKSSGLEIDHIRYRQYQNTLNRPKQHEKWEHYKNLFQKIGKNSKLLWNVVNSLIKKTVNKTEVPEILHDN